QLVQKPRVFDALGLLDRRRTGCRAELAGAILFKRYVVSALAAKAPLMITNDADQNAEDPRLHRSATIVTLDPALNDHEHILGDVVCTRLRHAESARAPPHEVEVRVVDLG